MDGDIILTRVGNKKKLNSVNTKVLIIIFVLISLQLQN